MIFAIASLQISLLESKKSMNVNIFMKQFGKLSHSEVVDKIRQSQHESIGQEKLLGLMKILPTTDEVRVMHIVSLGKWRIYHRVFG